MIHRHPALLVLALLLAALPAVASIAPVIAQSSTPETTTNIAITDLSDEPVVPFDATMQAALDAYAADLADRLGVVGFSMAVTQANAIVYARGHGLRDLGGTQPVTPDTRFLIGSINKSMTSLMAATLVDDGLVSWETPITDLLPDLRLSDPDLAARVTLADSFCACTGLPLDDVQLILNPAPSPAVLLDLTAEIPVVSPFREQFNYSNQMYAAGGFAATVAAGGALDTIDQHYAHALQERVLDPIGMTASTLSFETVLASSNYALPHGPTVAKEVRSIPLLAEERFLLPVAPAGGLWSTAPDMARYLATQMNDGIAPTGVRVVSPENLIRTQRPGISLPTAQRATWGEVMSDAAGGYAMGWLTGTWNGLQLLTHSGGTLGFNSEVAMLPDVDTGIVILTNGGAAADMFTLGVQFRFLELLYGLEGQFASTLDEAISRIEAAAQSARTLQTADPASLAPAAGRYANPQLGDLRLSIRGDQAILTLNAIQTRLVVSPDDSGQFIALDPPFTQLGVAVAIDRQAGADPEIVLTSQADPSRSYRFTPVE